MNTPWQGFGCWSTDYTRASLSQMEKIYFDATAVASFWQSVPFSPIQELVVLSTCNRVEWYFYAQDVQKASEWLLTKLAQFKGISEEMFRKMLVFHQNEAVAHHLFRVVSGIESMVFGENEILSQVKEALALCHKLNTTGAMLNKLFQTSVATGKRVRKETQIGRGSYSISSIAVEGMREKLAHFNEASILIVGAGTMSLRAIKKLDALEHPNMTICNRSEEKLVRLADKYGLRILPFRQLSNRAKEYTCILVATSADHYLLSSSDFTGGSTTQLVVDLSVPRNVDPEIESDTIHVLSVEHLKAIADKTIETRKQELVHIKEIMQEECQDLEKWLLYKQGMVPQGVSK